MSYLRIALVLTLACISSVSFCRQGAPTAMTYQKSSRNISAMSVSIGSSRDAAYHWVRAALHRSKILLGASCGRGVTGYYVAAKDEARAIVAIKRDARVHGYEFYADRSPESLESACDTKAVLVATVPNASSSFATAALRAANIPCARASAQSRTHLWILGYYV